MVLLYVTVIAVIVAALAIIMLWAKKTGKIKSFDKETDYRTYFIIGIIWMAVGVPLGIGEGFSPLWIIGLVFMGVGLANRDKWKEPKKSKLSPKQRKKMILLIIVGTAVLAVVLATFLVLKG
ncbi:hypothetical protein CL614_03220 [archaeon]|nr:hypothetical protein [archaeon]|tara:strand:+ start:208 stop:573 length:366 start_codon:yes stop_codon:yes gene_type:complete